MYIISISTYVNYYVLKMTEESIINLVEQIILRHGTIPIGEIGKQMQLTTQNPGNTYKMV